MKTHLVRSLNVLVTLATLSLVAQLGCSGNGSSTDAGHDTKVDKPAGNTDKPDVATDHGPAASGPDATPTPTCADGGARAVAGEACSCASDCQSGFCVDGVCCDSACGDTCKRCDVKGSMGTCSFVPAGLPPRAAAICPTTTAGTCGTDGTCDGQGACRKYVAGTVCQPGTCNGAAVTNIKTCDGNGTCAAGADKVCVPYSCDATKQDCAGSCTTNADCALGVQCMNGSCGLKMRGTGCKTNDECASGFCTDGVCCAVSCQGACVSCNQTGKLGTCWPIDQGVPDPRAICKDSGPAKCGQTGACDGFGSCAKYAPETVCVLPSCAGTKLNTPGTCDGQGTCKAPGVQECMPYTCASGACNVTCNTNADCAPGIACQNHSCGKLTNGGTCKAATDCASGNCVDGVCCDTACTGSCRSCALASAKGTCTPIAANSLDNRNICKDQGVASCGTNGRCDGAGGCAKYATGTVCGGEKCAANVYTGPPTCSSTGQCVAPTSSSCVPYACNGTKCFGACTVTANCSTPNVCNGNSCGKKLNGAQCSGATECGSGVCAQGYCCATTCNAACKSCGLMGTEGTCTNVPTGTLDPKNMCVDQGAASCGTNGRCAAGACQKYSATTKCADPTCPAGTTTSTGQSTCDGAGKCVTPGATNCFPYACGAAVCNSTCKSNADCANNASCINGSCGLLPKGGQCSNSNQCSTGLVCSAQGVCCDKACSGPCNSCKTSAAPGTCSPLAAGVTDTTGQCGVSTQSTCGNDGTCDGAGACHKWAAGTQCVAASCPSGASTQTLAKTCDGAGNCSVGGGPHPCGVFMCDGAQACLVTCTMNSQCVSPNTCVGTTCGKKPLGAHCTIADECVAGAFCTDGFCCSSSACGACKACGATGACQNDDGNACPSPDLCHPAAGICSGGACVSTPKTCTALDQCHVAGTCNPATGLCSNPAATNGTSCNDGDKCKTSETCQSGVCSGGISTACQPLDQCHVAGTCDSTTGACSNPAATNGTSCNDGNKCTNGETCSSGTCGGGTPKVCGASDQCHVAGACDPGTGLCSNPAATNGTDCDDNNACTNGESCQSGACTGGTTKVCTALDQCHVAGTCDPGSGNCSNPAASNGTGCNDGNACTNGESCQSGACSGGTAKVCSASDQCHVAGTCDPGTGACSNPTASNGTICNDGNGCTSGETCTGGTCGGGTQTTCQASDQCHVAGTCNPSNGACSNPNAPDDTPCESHQCTLLDTCQSGSCQSSGVMCDPGLCDVNNMCL